MINSTLSCHFSKICKCYATNFKLLNFPFKEPRVFWTGCGSVLMKHLAREPKDLSLVSEPIEGEGENQLCKVVFYLHTCAYTDRQTSGTIRTYFFKEHMFFCLHMHVQPKTRFSCKNSK